MTISFEIRHEIGPGSNPGKRPRWGRNNEVNAQLAEEEEGRARCDGPLCIRAHLPDALEEATALPRDRQVLVRGLDRAHRAWSPVGSLQHKGDLCPLGDRNFSRKMATFRNLRFLPNMTIFRRSRLSE
jgi:hypothetical protein